MKVNPFFKFRGRVADMMAAAYADALAARERADAADAHALLALIALLLLTRLTY